MAKNGIRDLDLVGIQVFKQIHDQKISWWTPLKKETSAEVHPFLRFFPKPNVQVHMFWRSTNTTTTKLC